jgi:hypothetical protein
MIKHPYLRAYLAGIAVPTVLLLVAISGYTVLRYVFNIPVPMERIIVFPMAAVPNLWGLWNVIYVARITRHNVPLGLFGSFLPLILGPIGYGISRLLDFSIPSIIFHLLPIGFPAVLIIYYLAWKHLVGFLNRELELA